MTHARRRLPWAVATLSLLLALTSTAVAAAPALASAMTKKQVVKIVKKQLAKKQGSFRVAHARTATIGMSPVAYATVAADGTVITSRTRGLTNANVDRDSTGGYCFQGLTFPFRTAMATIIWDGALAPEDRSAMVTFPDDLAFSHDCTNPAAQLEVVTVGDSNWKDAPFTVWFYN